MCYTYFRSLKLKYKIFLMSTHIFLIASQKIINLYIFYCPRGNTTILDDDTTFFSDKSTCKSEKSNLLLHFLDFAQYSARNLEPV